MPNTVASGFSRMAVKKKEKKRKDDEDDEDDNSHRQRTEQFRKVIKRDLVETVHLAAAALGLCRSVVPSLFAYALVQM